MSLFSKFKFISCETGPNSSFQDGLLALKILLFSWLFRQQKNAIWVHNWFRKYLNLDKNHPIYLTGNGRTALYLLLKSLNLLANTKVLIQGFSCVLVPNAVLQAGYKPIICEIEMDTFNFDLDKITHYITPETRVWIVQHTFGFMPNMDKVKEICQKYNLILIEDCAHSLGSSQNGQVAGSYGDASIFSFGRDKIVTSTTGGLAVINKKDAVWQAKLNQEYQKLPPMSKKVEYQALFFTILAGWILPFYHFGVGKLALKLSLKFQLIPEVYTQTEIKGTHLTVNHFRYSLILAKLLKQQLLNFDNNIRHRRTLAQIYTQELDLKYDENSAYLRFPLNLQKLQPQCKNYADLYKHILTSLRKEGVFAGLWYKNIFITPQTDLKKFGYTVGQLPITENLLNYKILNLPTSAKTSAKDAYRISKIIRQ